MAFIKKKIVLQDELLERVKNHIEQVGFTSVEEFVAYCVEKELGGKQEAGEELMAERLKGLGYIE